MPRELLPTAVIGRLSMGLSPIGECHRSAKVAGALATGGGSVKGHTRLVMLNLVQHPGWRRSEAGGLASRTFPPAGCDLDFLERRREGAKARRRRLPAGKRTSHIARFTMRRPTDFGKWRES